MVRRRRYSLSWKFERGLRPEGVAVIAGVDEVGRGCWAGPVFAAAAILPDGLRHGISTIRSCSRRECREELSEFLCAPRRKCAGPSASPRVEEIETHNILRRQSARHAPRGGRAWHCSRTSA